MLWFANQLFSYLCLWPPSSTKCNTFSQAWKRIPHSNEPNLPKNLSNLVRCLVSIVGFFERTDLYSACWICLKTQSGLSPQNKKSCLWPRMGLRLEEFIFLFSKLTFLVSPIFFTVIYLGSSLSYYMTECQSSWLGYQSICSLPTTPKKWESCVLKEDWLLMFRIHWPLPFFLTGLNRFSNTC